MGPVSRPEEDCNGCGITVLERESRVLQIMNGQAATYTLHDLGHGSYDVPMMVFVEYVVTVAGTVSVVVMVSVAVFVFVTSTVSVSVSVTSTVSVSVSVTLTVNRLISVKHSVIVVFA